MDVLIFLVSMFTLLMMNCGCQITYYGKSGYQQLWILSHREPIEKVLQSPDLSDNEKNKLQLTLKVREYAKNQLKLNVGKSYSTYVKLNKPYVVWAVNAAEKWQLQHYEWKYPFLGSLPYKGFPEEADAHTEAQSLDPEKYDTYVRGVSTYSTLGWFADPLLSTMIKYRDFNFASVIIHESVHATLFIKNNADFNERLASFVGDKGAEQYFFETEGPLSPTVQQLRKETEDDQIFANFISQSMSHLKKFYDSNPEHKEELRLQEFQKIKDEFRVKIKPQLKTQLHLKFDELPLNNAKLMLFKTYSEDLNDFEKLYQQCQQQIPLLIEKLKTLEKSSDPLNDLKKMVASKE
jgi:predicted aminopeptidase